MALRLLRWRSTLPKGVDSWKPRGRKKTRSSTLNPLTGHFARKGETTRRVFYSCFGDSGLDHWKAGAPNASIGPIGSWDSVSVPPPRERTLAGDHRSAAQPLKSAVLHYCNCDRPFHGPLPYLSQGMWSTNAVWPWLEFDCWTLSRPHHGLKPPDRSQPESHGRWFVIRAHRRNELSHFRCGTHARLLHRALWGPVGHDGPNSPGPAALAVGRRADRECPLRPPHHRCRRAPGPNGDREGFGKVKWRAR